jgi:hypothetical protein
MINVKHNWLEPEILAEIKQKFEDAKGGPNFEINNMGRWGQGLDAGSYAPVFIMPLDEYRDYFVKKYQDLDLAFKDFNNATVFMHIWPPGSQIAWHHDMANEDQAPRIGSTIYINETWNWNWGGLFLYDDPDNGQGWVFYKLAIAGNVYETGMYTADDTAKTLGALHSVFQECESNL